MKTDNNFTPLLDMQKQDRKNTSSINSKVAKEIMGWREIQAPQYDYNGPLPEQGVVLVPPGFDEDGFRGWPNKGIIPYDYFVGDKYSSDIKEALRVAAAMTAMGYKFNLSSELGEDSSVFYVAKFSIEVNGGRNVKRSQSINPAFAICAAALGFKALSLKRAGK